MSISITNQPNIFVEDPIDMNEKDGELKSEY